MEYIGLCFESVLAGIQSYGLLSKAMHEERELVDNNMHLQTVLYIQPQ